MTPDPALAAALARTPVPVPADRALLLLLSGILLLYAEFNRPGTVLLGAAGTLLLMLGVNTLLPLTLSPSAAVIAAAGIAVVLVQLRFPLRGRHAILALAGAAALVFGLHALVASRPAVSWLVAACTGIVFAATTYALGRIAVLAARNKRLPRPPARG